jgi:hypothetical protein
MDEWVIEVTPQQFRESNGRSLDKMALMQSVLCFDASAGLPIDPKTMTMMRSLSSFFDRHDQHGLSVGFFRHLGIDGYPVSIRAFSPREMKETRHLYPRSQASMHVSLFGAPILFTVVAAWTSKESPSTLPRRLD